MKSAILSDNVHFVHVFIGTVRTVRFSKKSLGSDVGVDTAKCPRKIDHSVFGDLL